MSTATAYLPPSISKTALRRYLFVLGIAYLAVVVYLLLEKGPRLWGPAIGLPLAIALVTSPRIAVYQFLFCLFLDMPVLDSPAIYLIDISAGLLVLSALLDTLLNPQIRGRKIPMTLNYLAILGALCVAAFFSVEPSAAIFPLARVIFLFAVFLSFVRLGSRVSVSESLHLFLLLMAIHAILAAVPSIASGGRIRSFGIAGTAFDDLAMLLAPCGLAFYLWSTNHMRKWYLAATLVILAGLIGTQSRFAILVCALLCTAVVVVSMIQARRLRSVHAEPPPVGHRAGILVLWLIALLLLFVVLVPSVLERALARFGAAASTTPGGTILLRLTLWKAAIKVFSDHPLTGIGPGVFRYVDQYYGSLWFGSTYPFVRGLSAHNLFLHYLAESGIIGVLAMLSLFFNQFFHAAKAWSIALTTEKASQLTALVVVSSGILLTAFLEGAWMWSATGFAASYFIAQIAIVSHAETAHDRSYLPS